MVIVRMRLSVNISDSLPLRFPLSKIVLQVYGNNLLDTRKVSLVVTNAGYEDQILIFCK